MNVRMSTAQKTAVAPAAIVAGIIGTLPGTYQSADDAPPARNARTVRIVRMGGL